jgi:hypothetical protein
MPSLLLAYTSLLVAYSSIYSFIQSIQCCASQAKATARTLSATSSSKLWSYLLHHSNLQLLTTATNQLSATANPAIHWMPDFGCALLPVRGPLADKARMGGLRPAAVSASVTPAAATGAVPAVLRPDDLALYLVFPDRREFDIHRYELTQCRIILAVIHVSCSRPSSDAIRPAARQNPHSRRRRRRKRCHGGWCYMS